MREIKKKQARIRRIQQRLSELGAMRPGSLSRQYNVCGNPQCRCKDPVKPKKHGPYHQLGYYSRGKHTTEFIKEEELREVKKLLRNYKTFDQLTKEWVQLSVEIAKLKKQLAKDKSKA